jgi:Recombinase
MPLPGYVSAVSADRCRASSKRVDDLRVRNGVVFTAGCADDGPAAVDPAVAQRIAAERDERRTLAEIARGLNDEGVPTAHGGRCWYPVTVRTISVRTRLAA